jgi:hypothetical protein
MSAELATIDGEIIEQRAPMTLFGTDDPTAVVDRASAVATALGEVINQRKLFASIGGKKHVQVEGWTLLGSMLGVFAEIEWSRPLDNGWEARAVARTLAGNVVGAAEAMCTVNEGRWKSADTYAVRSMAQTRAVSKALRMPLGFIMHLAGYSPTPAEEVPEDQPERSRGPARAASSPSGSAPVRTPEEQALLDEILAVPGMTYARMHLLADAVNVPTGTRANADQLRAMLALAEQPVGVPSSPADTSAPVADQGAAEARAAAPTDTSQPERAPDSSGSDAATAAAGGDPVPSPAAPSTFTTPETLETYAAAVLGFEEPQPLKSLTPAEFDQVFDSLGIVDVTAYSRWYNALERPIRTALMAASQSPRHRRDAAKDATTAKPDAEQLRTALEGES